VQQTVNPQGVALQSLFNSTDEKFHAKLRRAVSNAYAMSTLVQFEPLVDSTTIEFLRQLEIRFADRPDNDGICDLGTWLQYFAFDVIGELTYSKRLGFVDRGEDVDGIIGALERLLNYVSVVRAFSFFVVKAETDSGHIDWADAVAGPPSHEEPSQALAWENGLH
jgi:hypothetical protein